jgi:hypothetical protein
MSLRWKVELSVTRWRAGAWVGVLAGLTALLPPAPAWAVPAFARQMGVPCAVCHTVAFGPALTAFGRNFKLHGYSLATKRTLPLSADLIASYTHTAVDLPALPHYSENNNVAVDTVDVFLAGRIAEHFGMFGQVSYDGLVRHTNWANLDLRYAQDFTLGGTATLFGVSVNNSPTVQDPWNSTPVWQFPFPPARFANGPAQQPPQIFAAFAYTSLGATAYTLIDNTVYLEAGGYRQLSDGFQKDVGIPDPEVQRKLDGFAPYWRAALQKTSGPHYGSVGIIGFHPSVRLPQETSGATDNFTDTGFDATYQFANGGPHTFSANASYIHEDQRLFATTALAGGGMPDNHQNRFKVDGQYGFRQTYSVTLAYFDYSGNTNTALFRPAPLFGSANGSPNTTGYMLQLECIPFGKAGSFASPWVNMRLGVQYTGYTQLNGGNSNYDGFGHSASDNNTLFVYLWMAI